MESAISISSRSLQYYVIARRWLAELEFFKLETAFLYKLFQRNMAQVHDENHLKKLAGNSKKLRELEALVAGDLLAGQINQLELMAEDIIPEDAEALAANQVKLEYFMANIVKTFREVKKDIFELVLDAKHDACLIAN